MHDPIGPGTPAWNAADIAIESWSLWRAQTDRQSPEMKRLYKRAMNAITYMTTCLQKHGTPDAEIKRWKDFVKEQSKT